MSAKTKPVQLFTGKGGVGKSSVVAAWAMACAKHGGRPLIVELGHRASMESVFGAEAIGFEPVQVARGVWAMNVGFQDAVSEYLSHSLPVRAMARRVAKSQALARFFEAAPAVAEVATLFKLERLYREGQFSPILVDLDATGHALMFLELPRVFEGIARQGALRAMLDRTTALFEDRATTAINLVTLPTALPIRETIDLHARLIEQGVVGIGAVIVNARPSRPEFDRESLDALEQYATRHDRLDLTADVALGRQELSRRSRAEHLVAELRSSIAVPILELPWVPDVASSGIEVLAAGIAGWLAS